MLARYIRKWSCVEASDRWSSNRSDRYAASAAWTWNLLPGREPIREEMPWIDLASASQLDLFSSATGMKGDKKLVFGKEELRFRDKK
jgi:hypothetical protein